MRENFNITVNSDSASSQGRYAFKYTVYNTNARGKI